MVYSIAAQMVEHKGDPGAWKSTQRKVLDGAQFKRIRVTSRSHPGPGEIAAVQLLFSRESLQGAHSGFPVCGMKWLIHSKSQAK